MSSATLQHRIENLIAMARLLERADACPTLIGARQYRQLVLTVQNLLDDVELPDDARRAVMRLAPACAVLYENLHYDRSGLSQSPLDASIASEQAAVEAIERMRRPRHPQA